MLRPLVAMAMCSVLAGCGVMWLTHPPQLPARMTEIVPTAGGP